MSSLNDIILIITKEKVTCFEEESFVHQNIKDEIEYYDDLLEKLTIPRAKINELKEKKDKLVKQYINETKAPKSLNIKLLNYKALLFYFKDNFIKTLLILKLADYKKNGKVQNGFANFFVFQSNFQIKTKGEFLRKFDLDKKLYDRRWKV